MLQERWMMQISVNLKIKHVLPVGPVRGYVYSQQHELPD